MARRGRLALLLRGCGLGLGLLLLVVVFRATFPPDLQRHPVKCDAREADFIHADTARIARFQQMLRVPTITTAEHTYDREQLKALHAVLRQNYPLVFSSPAIKTEVVANYSLLFTWRGTDPNLKAAMLTSHMDVVPIENSSRWEQPPFSANIHNGYIYARGSLDDKSGVAAILEVMEHLLATRGIDYRPRRTFIIAFGHDEEASGLDGAAAVGRLLEARGERVEFLIDEGLPISVDLLPFVKDHVALVGVAEKGYMNVELNVAIPVEDAGHSSRPPPEQAIVILSQAIARVHRNPMPAHLAPAALDMFEHIAPLVPWFARLFLCNMWLFKPAVEYLFGFDPATNALARTTLAVTMINGGFKVNALPSTVSATINLRIGLGDTSASVLQHLRNVINDDRIQLRAYSINEPQQSSSCDTFGFAVIETSLRQVFPDVSVAPSLMVGGTDTNHYSKLTKNIYRFLAVKMNKRDISRLHGDDERIEVASFEKLLNFYHHVFVNADQPHIEIDRHHDEEL